jgi:protein phosphatase
LRAGLFYQISDDHSLVNEQLKLGILKRGDPMISQIRNVITRCVGYQEDEEVDTFALPLFRGDRFLLCSDGLTGKVSDAEIAERLGHSNLVDAPKDLVELANQRGGDDNITVVVLEVL